MGGRGVDATAYGQQHPQPPIEGETHDATQLHAVSIPLKFKPEFTQRQLELLA
jgi:hypothetical protein